MILKSAIFRARLVELPELRSAVPLADPQPLGAFTVDRKYLVHAIFDSGAGWTDFLVADDEGEFHWINMGVFRRGRRAR